MTIKYIVPTLLLCMGLTFAQHPSTSDADSIEEFVIDLNDDRGVAPEVVDRYNALKQGEFFRLRIENVNTYLYDVSVVNHDIDRTVALPENLLKLVDFGGLKSSLSNLNSVSEIVKQFIPYPENSGLRPLHPQEIETAQDLQKYLARVRSEYRSVYDTINQRHGEVNGLFERAEKFQNTMTTVERDVFGHVPTKEDIKTLLTAFDTEQQKIIAIRERLIGNHTDFSTVVDANRATVANSKELKVSVAEIEKVYTALLKASNTLMAQLSGENYGQFSAVLIGIINNLDFRYTTLPIQRYHDVNELQITLKPRDKNSKLSGYSTVLRIPDIEKSFWGVSTGFYVTDNPQRNVSIIEREENGQTLYDFLEEDSASVELGINTMVRYGRRIGVLCDTPIFWHLGFGAGLSIDQKFKPRLMTGTGLAFGRKNKLFVDFGAINMYYDTLSKAFTEEGNTTLPEDFLVSATKIQGYLSMGYLIQL